MSIYNAKITSTFLGIEDHGIMTFMLNLSFDSTGIGYGGYGLDTTYSGSKIKTPSSNGLGYQAIRYILETVGKYSWEALPNTLCRIDFDNGPGNSGRITRIGNILEEKWFDLQGYMKNQS